MTTLESIESTMTISAKFDQSFELLSLAGTAGTFGTWNFVDIHPLDGTYTDNLVGLGWVGLGWFWHGKTPPDLVPRTRHRVLSSFSARIGKRSTSQPPISCNRRFVKLLGNQSKKHIFLNKNALGCMIYV